MLFLPGKSFGFAGAILLRMATAYPKGDKTSNTVEPGKTDEDEKFEWGAVGDSWTSGVAYSAGTLYKKSDREACFRTNEAWGAQMEADKSWTSDEQNFHFAGCGGTLMDDIQRQMKKTGDSKLILGTIGGNNGFFGDIARACIYKPAPGRWGKDYENDPKGEGECKKALKKSRDYIKRKENGLRDDFHETINNIFVYKQGKDQKLPRFDLYVSSYVEFFDATTDECDKWTFGRWFSTGYAKLVKPLRAEMNELVKMFNDVQADTIKQFKKPSGYDYNVHFMEVSDEFKGHRFCEKGHTEKDQWTSSDVWIWNLQWNNGETSTDTGGKTKPDKAPKGPFPVMSLDTRKRTKLDDEVFANSGGSQSGFGWTARPFHPKPKGHKAMKEFFIKTMKKDRVPGIKGVGSSAPKPTPASNPKPTSKPCVGNQVQKKCMAGLPPAKPYSGIQPPNCARADGSKGSLPRINEKEATTLATQYCRWLINSKVILQKDTKGSMKPYPFTYTKAAENKGEMSLYVSYDVAACPKDKKTSTLDFKKLGQKDCEKNFENISTVCAQDKTWDAYNKDFTLMGGVFRNDCAIWTLSSKKG